MKRMTAGGLMILVLAAGAASAGPREILPESGEVEGWKIDGEMLHYLPDNLWEYINGQAENFLQYDFEAVAAAHYTDGSGREIKAEVYEHGSPLMAFGIYSQLRSPDAEYFDLGNEAFGDDYSIHFWKGRYYVKILSYGEDEESAKAMSRFARIVEDEIPAGGGEPDEIGLFPRDGLVEKSITYITAGALGSSGLPPAFVGEYSSGDEEGRLFLFPMGSVEEARDLFERYSAETEAETGEATSAGGMYRYAVGEAPYRGRMYIFQAGRVLGVFAGFGEGGTDARLAAAAVRRIRSAERPKEKCE